MDLWSAAVHVVILVQSRVKTVSALGTETTAVVKAVLYVRIVRTCIVRGNNSIGPNGLHHRVFRPVVGKRSSQEQQEAQLPQR